MLKGLGCADCAGCWADGGWGVRAVGGEGEGRGKAKDIGKEFDVGGEGKRESERERLGGVGCRRVG